MKDSAKIDDNFQQTKYYGIIFNDMDTIQSRIKQFADYKAIKIGTLEAKIGASKGVLSRAITQNTDIQSKWLKILVENYPEISAQWLLTGEGSMLRIDREPNDTCTVATRTENPNEGIPLIPISAMAGIASGEVSVMDYECERYIVPTFRNADYLIQVSGDSMMPKYLSGDLVACKELPLSDLFFQWNRTYVLDTKQGTLIKRIKKGHDAEHLLIVSENPEYEPFELHVSQINAVAIVLGLIRIE